MTAWSFDWPEPLHGSVILFVCVNVLLRCTVEAEQGGKGGGPGAQCWE